MLPWCRVECLNSAKDANEYVNNTEKKNKYILQVSDKADEEKDNCESGSSFEEDDDLHRLLIITNKYKK